ncbi:hypothetical protein CXF95_24705 [Paraglaciecola sp. MB-3u-78]|nr:hypothetical protein CXF95_24705 [Paraglaciecola sp. MB-3u-78]
MCVTFGQSKMWTNESAFFYFRDCAVTQYAKVGATMGNYEFLIINMIFMVWLRNAAKSNDKL